MSEVVEIQFERALIDGLYYFEHFVQMSGAAIGSQSHDLALIPVIHESEILRK